MTIDFGNFIQGKISRLYDTKNLVINLIIGRRRWESYRPAPQSDAVISPTLSQSLTDSPNRLSAPSLV